MTDQPVWRKSSFSSGTGECVEVGDLGGEVAVRNSNHPDAGTLHLPAGELGAWITGARSGDLDDLTT